MSGINVLIVRPERRFGYAITVWRDNPFTGKREVLRWNNGSLDREESWEAIELHTEVPPTFFTDDRVMEALVHAWRGEHPEPEPDLNTPGLLIDALADTQTTRDRLLTIIEKAHGLQYIPKEK